MSSGTRRIHMAKGGESLLVFGGVALAIILIVFAIAVG